MIPKLYLVGGSIVVFALWTGGVFLYGDSHGRKSCEARVNAASLEAANKARETERKEQERVNAIIKKQYEDMAGINATLSADLERLQQRESRRHLSTTSKTSCKGTSGAELSREDASFLTREATRADRLRKALESCYKVVE